MTDYKKIEKLLSQLLIVVQDNKEAVQLLKVEQIKLQRQLDEELERMREEFVRLDELGRDPGNEL